MDHLAKITTYVEKKTIQIVELIHKNGAVLFTKYLWIKGVLFGMAL